LDGRVRTVLAAIAVALVLIVPLVLLFAGGGGDDDGDGEPQESGLRLERSATELIAYVEPADNVPERAGGARSVTLRCVDADDRLVIAANQAWPFADTDGGTLDAHAHLPLDPASLDAVASCRVLGTEPLLAGAAP
jgi:hypothetical protein